MYVVVEAGGRQYKLEKNTQFLVNRMGGKAKSAVKLKNVLFAKDKSTVHVGNPYLKDAYVMCEVVAHPRAKKVIAFKYKRRKSSKKKVGHRQDLTYLKVTDIKI